MSARPYLESPARETKGLAEELARCGDGESAQKVRQLAIRVEDWETALRDRVGEALSTHHDLNNALTGVLGNAQLLLMGPAAEVPGAKKRLELLVHEAERIRDAACRLCDLRYELMQADHGSNPISTTRDKEVA